MAKYEFTATHGVHLWDLGVQFKKAEDRVDDEGRSHKVYAFGTDDPLVAAALLEVDGYGIETEDAKAIEAAAKKAEAQAEAERKAAEEAAAAEAEAAAKAAAQK